MKAMKTGAMKTNAMLFLGALLAGPAAAIPRPDHVVMLILENHGDSSVIGSTYAPYINKLAGDSLTAKFTQSFALTHPSQPNYLMLFSGSKQGITDDAVPGNLPFKTANLGASLLAKSLTFIGYSDDLPSIGFTGATSNGYARKHAPWVNWQGTGVNGIPSTAHLPFTGFPTDYTTLPTLSIVVPNLQHDMHDGTVAQSDTWIKTYLDGYVQWAKTHNSLFILTFDEDENKGGPNRVPTFFLGPMVKKGSYSSIINHYNVLRTLEDMYGLTHSGEAATANPITEVWRTPTAVGQADLQRLQPRLSAQASAAGQAMVFNFPRIRDPSAELEIRAIDGKWIHRAALRAGMESYAWKYGKQGERKFFARLRDGKDEASFVFTLP